MCSVHIYVGKQMWGMPVLIWEDKCGGLTLILGIFFDCFAILFIETGSLGESANHGFQLF